MSIADTLHALSAVSLFAWLYLILFHGQFWRCREKIDAQASLRAEMARWPSVAAVVPARNEADVIGESVDSLLRQAYPGGLKVVVVDDHSVDGTAEAAADAARRVSLEENLIVVKGADRPIGWTGKLWALQQGVEEALRRFPHVEFLLLTDADIEHDLANLRALMLIADGEGSAVGKPDIAVEKRDLVSVMVKLHCVGFWERLLIPPFVYFFQQLYPFAWSNRPDRNTAAAAGGCMLVRRTALDQSGGLEAVKGAIIDDCALARSIKHRRSSPAYIWLGLSDTTRSLRPYEGLGGIWRMVARSAYTQLKHSPLLLAGSVLGMAMIYLAPPIVLIAGIVTDQLWPAITAGIAFGLAATSAWPIHHFYGLSSARGLLLPVVATLYVGMTIDSAVRTWLGRGGLWKDRVAGGSEGGA